MDFLFAFLHTKPLLKGVYFNKGSKFFSVRADPFSEGMQINYNRVDSPHPTPHPAPHHSPHNQPESVLNMSRPLLAGAFFKIYISLAKDLEIIKQCSVV